MEELRKKPLYWFFVVLFFSFAIYSIVRHIQIHKLPKEYIAEHPIEFFSMSLYTWDCIYVYIIAFISLLLVPSILYSIIKLVNPKVISEKRDMLIYNIIKVFLLVLAIGVPFVIYFFYKQFDIAFLAIWLVTVLILWGVLWYIARRK